MGQLAESFNDMAESLNRLEQSKRQFITNISHDIRSPLTSILGFVTAMQDGTAPTESFPKYLGIVRSEVERIIRLSNDIVDLNTLEEEFNKTVIQPFDINRLIRKCAEKFETAAKDKNLELELVFLEETAVVMGDSGKIERVLINLIDNAIKFTENGKISVMSDKDKNGLAVISVRDTGIGLSDTEAKRVFDRFYKVDKARSGTGSGLGLSIVKELLRANGSEISVSSANGEGTSFSFILPLAAACE